MSLNAAPQVEVAAEGHDSVRLYKEQFGRGPTKARTEFASLDIVICTLEDSLTPAERPRTSRRRSSTWGAASAPAALRSRISTGSPSPLKVSSPERRVDPEHGAEDENGECDGEAAAAFRSVAGEDDGNNARDSRAQVG
jgi:hypothetical protein